MSQKLLGIVLVGITLVSGIFYLNKNKSKKKPFKIGVLQTASHPALDATYQGFKKVIDESLGNSVEIVLQNAQGSVAQAHSIAQRFHTQKDFNAFFAIATPAAQALQTQEKQRPLVLSAVTDPAGIGLIQKDGNVCGVSDMVNVPGLVELVQELLPQAKTIGILYTLGEANSEVVAKKLTSLLEQKGLTPTHCTFTNETEVQPAMELACRKCDVIIAPTDNTVASTVNLLALLAIKHKKPFIVSDNMLIKAGPLASRGIDYFQGGRQAGTLMVELLKQEKTPSEYGVEVIDSKEIFINKKTLESLNIELSEQLSKKVTLVE